MTGFTTLNEALQTAMAHPGRPQVGLCVHPFPTFAAETSILIPLWYMRVHLSDLIEYLILT
jgi:hypothetical protein